MEVQKIALLACTALCMFSGPALAQDQARQASCEAKLVQAQKLDMLYNIEAKGHPRIRVLVGPTWYRVAFDAKEGFAQTVNCVAVGGKQDRCTSIDFVDHKSGRGVATFENCRLKAQ